jgi:hypothetical protein
MEVNLTSPNKNEELNNALDSWSHADGRGRNIGATEITNSNYAEDETSPSNKSSNYNGSSEDKVKNLNSIVNSQRAQILLLEKKLSENSNNGSSINVAGLLKSQLDHSLRLLSADGLSSNLVTKEQLINFVDSVVSKLGDQNIPSSTNDSKEVEKLKNEVIFSYFLFNTLI